MKQFELFWAKKKKGEHGEIYHPLLFHTFDVGIVARELWKTGLHKAIRHFFMTELGLSEQETLAWLIFLIALHDTGKASPAFIRQDQKAREALQQLGFLFRYVNKKCPHGVITAYVLADLLQTVSKDNNFPRMFGRSLGIAVGGHHGTFSGGGEAKSRQRGGEEWEDARKGLVEKLARLFRVPLATLPNYSQNYAFYVLLAGLTCVADWIGSNEEHFRYAPPGTTPEQYATLAQKRAREAVKAVGWANWRPPASVTTFEKLFPSIQSPWPCQKQVETLAPQLTDSASLVLIEAPMGEGKTEAAMFLADYWTAKLQQQGCYFALPTQATSNQMFGRVKRFIEGRYPNQRVNLQLVHGANLLSEEFTALRFRTYPEEDGSPDETHGNIAVQEWFLPKKRSLLAPFGVGTIDQALMAVLQTRHFFVRLFGLAHKTVIIDEVHAYDTYMSVLLERLLAWLRALGCSVVMLSATLPARKRQQLLQAYGGQTSIQSAGYPQITWASGGESGAVSFPAVQHRQIAVHRLSDSTTELAEKLREAMSTGGCIAVVCNTVGRAQEVYQALRQQQLVELENLQLLHSRFPFAEREKRERRALESFGKDGTRPKAAILVSTQIIEQSLDLDFDLMITDLAPADLVLQRAGRLHRHQNTRPAQLTHPALWLRMPDIEAGGVPDFGASQRIYDLYILLRSYVAFKDRSVIHLPEDLPAIVEEVYGAKGAWPSPELQQVADSAWEDMQRAVEKEKSTAKGNLIPCPDDSAEPDEFLERFSKGLEEDNPEIHQSLQALTRLTEPSVQVVCLSESDGLDLAVKPSPAQIRSFLRHAMTITDKRVVFTLRGQSVPSGWKRTPALRHHRLLIFSERSAVVGKYLLRLDPELGLLIDQLPAANGEKT